MEITTPLTDSAVLEEIGRRVRGQRLEARLTQAELAAQAGVGKRTLERLEAGAGTELVTLVRVLRVLGLIEDLERLVPVIGPGPIARLKTRGKAPQRVMHRRDAERPEAASTEPWTWGEE